MTRKPETVQEYLEALPADARSRLDALRQLALAPAPGAAEGLTWGQPAYSLHGVILCVISGHRSHANIVFTPTTLQAHLGELGGYTTGRGSIDLPYDQPLPTALLARMIGYRIRELHDDGVKWR